MVSVKGPRKTNKQTTNTKTIIVIIITIINTG